MGSAYNFSRPVPACSFYGGAGIAKAVGQKNVKRMEIVEGIAMGIFTLVKTYG
jgi:hypothetical protein